MLNHPLSSHLNILIYFTLRIQHRPKYRAATSVLFPDFYHGANALRTICQSGLQPANCRLVDPLEVYHFH